MGTRGLERLQRGRGWPALLLAGLAGCSRNPPETPRIETGDVFIRLGTAGVVNPERWNVLRVRVRNTGGDFRGTLEVRGTIGGQAEGVVYRMPVEVPGKGAAREISIAVRPQGWTGFRMSLEAPGWRKTWEEELALQADEPPARILISEARGTDWTRLLSEAPLSRYAVARIPPGELPEEALAYDPFAIVILNGVTLAGSSPGVAAALSRWVERGGILLAFPGPEWSGGIPGATLELLGVSAGDPARSPGSLARRVGSGTYRALDPLPGTEPILDGVAFLSRRGCGIAECFSFGPGEAFPDRSGGEALHRALGPALERLAAFSSRAARVLQEVEGPLLQTFFRLSGVTFPSWIAVAAAMSAYLLLGIVLPWGIFTRMRRREWTYPVMLAASALAVVAIARHGLLNATQSAECTEMSVARVHAGGSRAEVATYAALISPRRREAAFEPERSGTGVDVLAQPLRSEVLAGEAARIIETRIDAGRGGSALEPLVFYPNALRAFRFEHAAELEGLVKVQRTGGEVLVSNESTERLVLHVIQERGRVREIGDVGPGTSRLIDFSNVFSMPRQPYQDDPPERLFDAFLETLWKEWDRARITAPLLIARSSRPLLSLRAPGFRRRAHTFLIVEP